MSRRHSHIYDLQPHDMPAIARAEPAELNLAPDDRIGLQPRRRRRVVRRFMILLSCIGLGWLHTQDPTVLPWLWSEGVKHARPLIEEARQRFATARATVPAVSEPLRNETVATEASDTKEPMALDAPLAVSPADADERSPPSAVKVEKVVVKKISVLPPVSKVRENVPSVVRSKTLSDTYEKQAEAVGLHPGLSRVLLAQLTKTDFRNARKAIRTALAKTPDDETLSWPKRRRAGQARFKVYFVEGAGRDCRRYVVTIEKNRWLTTALPMEKCGIETPRKRRKTARARAASKAPKPTR